MVCLGQGVAVSRFGVKTWHNVAKGYVLVQVEETDVIEPWWSYPPEVNASRIIGIGPLPWIAAAGVWAMMAAEAGAAQAAFQSQNGIQAGVVHGMASPELLSSAHEFGSWLATIQSEAADAAANNAHVAELYFRSLGAMVPLPVIIANRVAAAAAHTATAVGAVNPAGVALDSQYAGFQVQNATTMTAYDVPLQMATAPKVFAPPPPLVSGGALGQASSFGKTAARAATSPGGIGKGLPGGTAGNVNAAKLATNAANTRAALPASAAKYAPTMGSVPTQAFTAGQGAMAPVQSIMGQLAGRTNGVTGTGLGSGGPSFTSPSSPLSRGGLALGGGGASAGLGGSGASLGSGARSVAGLGGAGLPAGLGSAPLSAGQSLNGAQTNTLGRIGPSFTGVDLAEKTVAARPGGMPLGGMGGGGGPRGGTGSKKSDAQLIVEQVQDTTAAAERERARERELFA